MNIKSLKSYFLKQLDDKLGFPFSNSFNFPQQNSKVHDNFEIILENGQRYSFFDDYNKDLKLKDLNINRWSKLRYRHTSKATD